MKNHFLLLLILLVYILLQHFEWTKTKIYVIINTIQDVLKIFTDLPQKFQLIFPMFLLLQPEKWEKINTDVVYIAVSFWIFWAVSEIEMKNKRTHFGESHIRVSCVTDKSILFPPKLSSHCKAGQTEQIIKAMDYFTHLSIYSTNTHWMPNMSQITLCTRDIVTNRLEQKGKAFVHKARCFSDLFLDVYE